MTPHMRLRQTQASVMIYGVGKEWTKPMDRLLLRVQHDRQQVTDHLPY